MNRQLFLGALLLCFAVLPLRSQQPGGCAPDGNVKFICGVPAAEDLVAVPRSEWVVASGLSGGGIHLVNTRDFTTIKVFPNRDAARAP